MFYKIILRLFRDICCIFGTLFKIFFKMYITRNWRNSTKFATLSLAYPLGSGCFGSSLWLQNDSPWRPNTITVSTIGAIAALTSRVFLSGLFEHFPQ